MIERKKRKKRKKKPHYYIFVLCYCQNIASLL
jgi:hypothetical protein